MHIIVLDEDFALNGDQFVFQFDGPSNESCIIVNITNDLNYEGAHSFAVRLSETPGRLITERTVGFASPPGPLIGPLDETMVIIIDPEGTVYIDVDRVPTLITSG